MTDQNTHEDLCEHIRLLDAHLDRMANAIQGLLAEIDDCSQPDLWENYEECLSAVAAWRSEWSVKPETPRRGVGEGS